MEHLPLIIAALLCCAYAVCTLIELFLWLFDRRNRGGASVGPRR
jgi:hypothetical protein